MEFIQQLLQRNNKHFLSLPDKELLHDFTEDLFQFLFIRLKYKSITEEQLVARIRLLHGTFSTILFSLLHDGKIVIEEEYTFFDAIPSIHNQLLQDAQTIVAFDVTAESIEDVLAAHPVFFAITVYRLAHQLYIQDIPLLPRLLSEYAHNRTGIDIHPGTVIDLPFFINHGTAACTSC